MLHIIITVTVNLVMGMLAIRVLTITDNHMKHQNSDDNNANNKIRNE